MPAIVELIDEVISDIENEATILNVRSKVNEMMAEYPLFAY
jgi:glycine hydroxymethyltransferase